MCIIQSSSVARPICRGGGEVKEPSRFWPFLHRFFLSFSQFLTIFLLSRGHSDPPCSYTGYATDSEVQKHEKLEKQDVFSMSAMRYCALPFSGQGGPYGP